MSENFELMQHPFHHRLNPLSSSPQAHVTQQIRRDKLRIAQNMSSYPSSSFSPSGIKPNFVLQSEEVEESRNSGISRSAYSGLPAIGGLMALQDPDGIMSSEMMNHFIASSEFPSVKESNIVHNVSGWKSMNSHSNSDCLINYMQHNTHNPVVNSLVLGPVEGGEFPFYNPDAQSSLSSVNLSNGGGYSFSGTQQNPVHQSQILTQIPQEIRIREQSQGLLVPSFGNLQSGQSGLTGWNSKQGDLRQNCHEASLEGGFKMDSTYQGLYLSLSSHNPHEMQLQQYESRFGSHSFTPTTASFYSMGRFDDKRKEECGEGSRDYTSLQKDGATLPSAPSVSSVQKNPVPLGPFTGYASVLKTSKFLKPAQQLLDEVCSVVKANLCSSEGNPRKFQASKGPTEMDGICVVSGASFDAPAAAVVNSQCFSSTSSAFRSADMRAEPGVQNPISSSADRIEQRRKKTRLVSMLDEVYRRYMHYYRQFQMVVTSFEAVAGLSNAAPYTSMALKAMSKHFRCLKNAINEQLNLTCKVLGEDCFPPSSTGRDKTSGLLLGGEHWVSGERSSVVEQQQQNVWRPQRGLPERAVAVLRAWLFEHFLHPYPTDTDKQMLSKQTGLTRNQVSNWFINARVRLWKPLVEEVHSLESRDSSFMDLNSVRKPDSVVAADGSNARKHQSQITLDVHRANSKQPDNCNYDNVNSPINLQNLTQPTKRSRADPSLSVTGNDCGGGRDPTACIGGASCQSNEIFSNVTHTRSGIGGVSLTLGLHHNGVCVPPHNETMHRLVSNDDHQYINSP